MRLFIRRPTKKSSVFGWACSNFPQCKQSYAESKNPKLKGRPDYSSGCNINHEQEV